MSSLGDSLGQLTLINPDPIHEGNDTIAMDTINTSDGVVDACDAGSSVDATIPDATIDLTVTENDAVGTDSVETESTDGITTGSTDKAEVESTDTIVSTDANQEITANVTSETQVDGDFDAQLTTDTEAKDTLAGDDESSATEVEQVEQVEHDQQVQDDVTVPTVQENTNKDIAEGSDDSDIVDRITPLPATVKDENEDNSDVTIVAPVAVPDARLAIMPLEDDVDVDVYTRLDNQHAAVAAGAYEYELLHDDIRIEVTTVGGDDPPPYSPITIIDQDSQDGYDGGSEMSAQDSAVSGYWAPAHDSFGPNVHGYSYVFGSGNPSIPAAGTYYLASTSDDDADSNASISTLVAGLELEDGGLYMMEDYLVLNAHLYPGQTIQNGPVPPGPIVSIVIGNTEIFVHWLAVGYSPFFQNQFRDGDRVHPRLYVANNSPEAWRLLTMCMYSKEWHPTRAEFSASDFFEALGLARSWHFQGPVENNLKKLTSRFFGYFGQWKGIYLNGLTAYIHKQIMMEINDAFVMCKAIPGPPPFPLTAFGLVILKCCPPAVWTSYCHVLDPELFAKISDISIRETNGIPYMNSETELISSM
ncbi:hypothetical protein F4810DRAFT_708774 [Camillea tinctor]|nr:hypothetical protein F4810DRAFT_708774 [Camillea tinctor]